MENIKMPVKKSEIQVKIVELVMAQSFREGRVCRRACKNIPLNGMSDKPD